ncbi:MAG: sigma-70 family RNA polymerase sigma factor [Chthoniobacter sp.]|nr:sigma-70 family RNA polymerase sigma factor [Chthoniobacter sp.]
MPATATPSDAELVQNCLTTGTDAFSEIVTRYQSLICALTYNATGNLARSEDLAQDVFLIAWKELRQLREPAKLRSWLCGIARRLTAKTLHRETREPACAAEILIDEHHAPEAGPADQAISREEEAILWRTIEQIPETYREPLILFYREGQSPQDIAAALDLTEDAARQRLSRGRKMLHEQVAQFVETMLRQTTPGRAFTLAIMLSLPALHEAAAASVGTSAAKGAAAAKGLTLAGIHIILVGPILGLLTAWHGVRVGFETARSERERQFLRRQTPIVILFVLLLVGGVFEFEAGANSLWDSHPLATMLLRVAWDICLPAGILALAYWGERCIVRIRAEEAPHTDPVQSMRQDFACQTFEYKSPWSFLSLPLLHIRSGRQIGKATRPAIGWIAIGDIAYGALFAAGGYAVGTISVGAFSCGVLSIGIISAGVLALGGLSSFGLWGAIGSNSVGYFAQGANALAWHAAIGIRAVAHDFAVGIHAYAPNANDLAARTVVANLTFFKFSRFLGFHHLWWQVVWLPVLFYFWQLLRVRRALRQSPAA